MDKIKMNKRITWPEGKDFAFTVFDDTDRATVENVGEVYRLLSDCGLRTTKSVWPVRGSAEPNGQGSTCEDRQYVDWLLGLKAAGFEIGYHNATYDSSPRERTLNGLDRFAELFGSCPQSMASHVGCLENIYWGTHRLSGANRTLYELFTRKRNQGRYAGHVEGSRYFWGDVCRQKIKYVRNFVFPQINTLGACPLMPYHDPDRPYVRYWYASSSGSSVRAFNKTISEKNQDRLEEEGGACIMYAHFAFGFFQDGEINPRFQHLIERLSRKNGWFVPVSTLLDYLLEVNGHREITRRERNRLERKWLMRKALSGTS
jgi:hypothetical protein